MRISRVLLATISLAVSLAATLAQEIDLKKAQPADVGVINDVDVTVTSLTEEKLNHPPKREIKIERLEEPWKTVLPKADPKLFEQKYVAIFALDGPANGSRYSGWLREEREGEVAALAFMGEWHLIQPRNASGKTSIAASFAHMHQSLPEASMVPKEDLEVFTNIENFGATLNLVPVSERNPSKIMWSVRINGKTPEQVASRCQTFLTLLDEGACRPLRLALFKKREPLCGQLRDQRKVLESARQAESALQNELKAYVDFTPDMLSNLRVQQLQLDIDLAGVKARIAACDKLLAQKTLSPERRNQIEDLKVAAEIEFSGFEARRTKSEEFIGRVKMKVELLAQSKKANDVYNRAATSALNLEEQIKNLDAAIGAYAPLPLVDNKITIRPLEWTQ